MELVHSKYLPNTRYTKYYECELSKGLCDITDNVCYIYYDKWLNNFYIKNGDYVSAYFYITWDRKILDIIFYEKNIKYPDSVKEYVLSFVGEKLEMWSAIEVFDKCYFCNSFDEYEGCEWGCDNHESFSQNHNRIIRKAKEKNISAQDVIALMNL